MEIKMTKSGFKRVRQTVVNLSTRLQWYQSRIGQAMASHMAARVRYHIDKQDLDWEPLSVEYLLWKEDMGLDERIWIATGQLYDAITVWKQNSQDGRMTWFGGIPIGAKNDEGISLGTIAKALEYGVPEKNIPARPLFRVSAQEVIEHWRPILASHDKKKIDREVNKYLRNR